jgi:hypothetical protein
MPADSATMGYLWAFRHDFSSTVGCEDLQGRAAAGPACQAPLAGNERPLDDIIARLTHVG